MDMICVYGLIVVKEGGGARPRVRVPCAVYFLPQFSLAALIHSG